MIVVLDEGVDFPHLDASERTTANGTLGDTLAGAYMLWTRLKETLITLTSKPDGREWVLEMMPKHSVGAEIGVFRGEFTRLILKIVRPQKLHLIDPWKYETDPIYTKSIYGGEIGKNQANMDAIYHRVVQRFGAKNVEIHRGTSFDCAVLFPDNYFDWIYVDGNHQYEFVKQDLETYYAKVKPGGIVAGDDYARKKDNWTQDGVTRAVDEIIAGGLYEKVLIKKEDHQFLLRKPYSS